MTGWFVSTTRSQNEDVEWLLTPCASEEAAKSFASHELVRGLRVEAGTLPGVGPKMRVGWQAAHRWAQSSNDDAILGLQRRVAVFADPRRHV